MSDVIDTALPPAPPPPPAAPEPAFRMAEGELFTREQYHSVGWTDEQLIAAGKMYAPIKPQVELQAPVGMPDSTWVMIDDDDTIPPTGLFIGHNGTGYMIRTGVPVRVPNHVLQVLDDAIVDAPVLDPGTKQIVGYRPRPRYSYRHVAPPADAA